MRRFLGLLSKLVVPVPVLPAPEKIRTREAIVCGVFWGCSRSLLCLSLSCRPSGAASDSLLSTGLGGCPVCLRNPTKPSLGCSRRRLVGPSRAARRRAHSASRARVFAGDGPRSAGKPRVPARPGRLVDEPDARWTADKCEAGSSGSLVENSQSPGHGSLARPSSQALTPWATQTCNGG